MVAQEEKIRGENDSDSLVIITVNIQPRINQSTERASERPSDDRSVSDQCLGSRGECRRIIILIRRITRSISIMNPRNATSGTAQTPRNFPPDFPPGNSRCEEGKRTRRNESRTPNQDGEQEDL